MNVYEAAQARLKKVFEDFDNVVVAFSGGKDSGVMLNMAVEFCRKNYPGRRIAVMNVDYEASYQMTMDYTDAELKKNADVIDVYRLCMPIAAKCATSMFQSYWIPWDADKREIWVRELPDDAIHEGNHEFPWFTKGMWDYDMQDRFAKWHHERMGAKRTATLVGIRTQESNHRWNAIHGAKKRDDSKFGGVNWYTKTHENCYNAYPIYDWKVDDIWVANAQFGWDYNKLYDLFHMAGVSFIDMRVASPFHDCGIEALKLYKVIDPRNWGKMIGRANGVNFAGLYGGTTAMGWKSIKLPPGYTWKGYMEFLLSTLPEHVAEGYKKKVDFSIEFWRTKGGGLSPATVQQLRDLGIPHTVGAEARKGAVFKENLPVTMEYQDDIDLPDFRLLPSYKRICVCIMRNDHTCKFAGFGATKTEVMLRAQAEGKYKDIQQKVEAIK